MAAVLFTNGTELAVPLINWTEFAVSPVGQQDSKFCPVGQWDSVPLTNGTGICCPVDYKGQGLAAMSKLEEPMAMHSAGRCHNN